jgi:TRAP-type C4-dicarboxylate transport system substrate-binding protein
MLPNAFAFMVPHITRDAVHAHRLYWKAYTTIPEIKAELDKNMKVLAVWGSDRSALYSVKNPILTPKDLVGKRVLIWNPGQADQIKAWGGSPVQVAPNETYLSLQRGMGDALFAPLPVGVAYKLMEVSKHITIIPATTLFLSFGMNWDAWKELPADLQKIITDTTGEAFSKRSGELLYEHTNKDIETMKAAGVTIHTLTEAQYQAFKDADKTVTMEYWNKELTRVGVANPAAAIARAYKMSAETPAAGK